MDDFYSWKPVSEWDLRLDSALQELGASRAAATSLPGLGAPRVPKYPSPITGPCFVNMFLTLLFGPLSFCQHGKSSLIFLILGYYAARKS